MGRISQAPRRERTTEEGRKIPKLQGRQRIQGLDIAIENAVGSYRHWYDPNNNVKGKTQMKNAYGYIQKTQGLDGDKVDVYIGPNPKSDKVFVVHQMKAPEFKEFDEDKCMIGFDTAKEAGEAYLKHYNTKKFFGSMTEMTMEKFKKKVFNTVKKPQMIKAMADKPEEEETVEEPLEPAVKLDHSIMAKVHGERKMHPASTTLMDIILKNNRRTVSPADYTRPRYEDES